MREPRVEFAAENYLSAAAVGTGGDAEPKANDAQPSSRWLDDLRASPGAGVVCAEQPQEYQEEDTLGGIKKSLSLAERSLYGSLAHPPGYLTPVYTSTRLPHTRCCCFRDRVH
uniref:F-box only protein 33-like isoform X2 n=1 Tax=Geotrypetes seraphini TaxID=260995 RepID=A0A6P8RSM9_GEOSA|nr:F-box only protein 33-like isoform X2 [Geotrypetes seraphini]